MVSLLTSGVDSLYVSARADLSGLALHRRRDVAVDVQRDVEGGMAQPLGRFLAQPSAVDARRLSLCRATTSQLAVAAGI